MLAAAKSLGLVLLAAYVFYDSFAAALFLIPAGVFYMTDCVADLEEKKEREFLGQFRDGIQAVAAGLKAGVLGGECDPRSRAGHRTAVQ